MNKIKSTLFIAIFVAITATTTLADGQIPIGGSPVAVGGQIPIGGSPVAAGGQIPIGGSPVAAGGQIPIGGSPESEPNNGISSEISEYLLTLAGIIGQLKF